ncbi:MAG: hypothetical protein JO126_09215 [Alphaproteobacteria bacterium]|nr:hypothetical protein [Alphaproteobacteria bacterium]MBV8549621.1 hypothetical protein [Alphaproteobacteria bacterium]
MSFTSRIASVLALTALAACDLPPPTTVPNYTVKVNQNAQGQWVAVPPDCLDWTQNTASDFDNMPMPQFGCATARNLAMMVDHPHDLLQGRPTELARGTVAAASINSYDSNQTRGLIDPFTPNTSGIAVTTAPSASSGGAGSGSGSGSSSGSGH